MIICANVLCLRLMYTSKSSSYTLLSISAIRGITIYFIKYIILLSDKIIKLSLSEPLLSISVGGCKFISKLFLGKLPAITLYHFPC